jgi:hypothetical protein
MELGKAPQPGKIRFDYEAKTDKDSILEAMKSNSNNQEIAEQFGVSDRWIRKLRKKLG